MVRLIKKSFVFVITLHILFIILSMINNGISITYFILFFLSILLFGFFLFLFSMLIRNSDSPNYFILILCFDIIILCTFIYSLIGKNNNILSSYSNCIIIPIRNIMVFFSIIFKIEATPKHEKLTEKGE